MKTADAYPSKYLSAEDLNEKDITLTIRSVELEEIGQGAKAERKLVIEFAGAKKRFVCNKTNSNTISKVLGSDETDDWIGQRITIGPREVEFQGDMVMSIRVSLKKPAEAAPKKKVEPDPVPSDNDGAGGEGPEINF